MPRSSIFALGLVHLGCTDLDTWFDAFELRHRNTKQKQKDADKSEGGCVHSDINASIPPIAVFAVA